MDSHTFDMLQEIARNIEENAEADEFDGNEQSDDDDF
jgi:hypothetical protein